MSLLMIIFIVTLVLIVLWQLGKASEYIASLKGTDTLNEKTNTWHAISLVGFLILLIAAVLYNHFYFVPHRMLPESASVQGLEYERLFNITLIFTGAVFFITQFLLFYFSWKYRYNKNRKAAFISHNNKLEIIWTVVPAVVMFVLVVFGLKQWFTITDMAPKNSLRVEVWGKQFNWMMRYPGADNKFGQRDWRLTNDANNPLGQNWDDKNGRDDIQTNELHFVKNRPVELIIGSRDVLHDVGLPHFRMKSDAVPGVMTTMWFTPRISTQEMIKKTGNPNFVYEICCDQMCGKGHYSMRGVVIVHETQADYDAWLAQQKPYYSTIVEQEVKSNLPMAADTTKTVSVKTENK